MGIKQKIITINLVSAIIIVGVIFFIVLPSIKDINQINQEIYQERLDLEKRYQRGQSLRKSLDELKKYRENIPLLDNAFIHKNEELDFLNKLEEIAKNNHVTLEKKLADPKQAPLLDHNFRALSLDLNVMGNFVNLISFIHQIEAFNQYINLETLSLVKIDVSKINSPIKENIENNINGKFKGLVFWLEEKIKINSSAAKNGEEGTNRNKEE